MNAIDTRVLPTRRKQVALFSSDPQLKREVATRLEALAIYDVRVQEGTDFLKGPPVDTRPGIVILDLGNGELLGKPGIVEAREGRDGGYRLARAPEQITLAEVYRAVTAPGSLPVTPVDASGCGRGPLRAAFDEVMAEAEEAAVAVMGRHTLADVMRHAEALGAAGSRPGRS